MQLEEVRQNSVGTLTTLPLQNASQDFYESAAPLYAVAVAAAGQRDAAAAELELQTNAAPPTHSLDDVVAGVGSSAERFTLSTNGEKYAVAAIGQPDTAAVQRNPPIHGLDEVVGASPEQFTLSTNREKFQAEINKWEEFYDQIQQHLAAGSSNRGVPKSACNFSMGQDGGMYYCKSLKDGGHVYLKVVRDYADRVRICKDIHLDTGDVTLHHRRDKMLEVLGQMYYWKGQRRDVCQCVRPHA